MTTPAPHPDASAATAAAHDAAARALQLDERDFDDAGRGLIAGPPAGVVTGARGWPIWNFERPSFLAGDAPSTVHPGLWRQARLNAIAGLFEVCPGIWQVRGFDLSNLTLVRGERGWIVIDPLTTEETARAALAFANEHLGVRPVTAVIYTHSHIDHFGGVRGVVEEGADVPIIAPKGFLDAAISENVQAGVAMRRRAIYMYGLLLPSGPQGHVDCGLGAATPFGGERGLIAPTIDVEHTGQELHVDGVRIVFQLTPDTEAPAEMNFLFPDLHALCMAENCTCTQHNLYTLRGAPVRDALAWSRYIDEAIRLYGDQTDVVFASHHWPRFGRESALAHLGRQRDVYRYIHDQTLRLANSGFTMNEIAERLTLPPSLRGDAAVQGYYGTVSHNVKAVYQRYLGWFDANPAHLNPHPPVEAAQRYVDYMGGADRVLEQARRSYEQGDYRWVAEVVNHVVFADPTNDAAKALQADALTQLGYQAESGPWRDFYLTGAHELRHGAPQLPSRPAASGDTSAAMTTEMLLDHLAIRLDGDRADGFEARIDVAVTDREERYAVTVEHCTLRHHAGGHTAPAATVRGSHAAIAELCLGHDLYEWLCADGSLVVDGEADVVGDLLELIDTFDGWFAIVTP